MAGPPLPRVGPRAAAPQPPETVLPGAAAAFPASVGLGGGGSGGGPLCWYFTWNNNSYANVTVYLNGEKVWWDDGSYYLAPGQTIPQFEILATMNLPDAVAYRVHRGNAIRVLKLGGS